MSTFKHYILYFICVALVSCSGNKHIIYKTLSKDDALKNIAVNPEYEVQIVYTTVDKNRKKFKSYFFQVDPSKYFYPASTVKMPVAILALQKIRDLNATGVPLNKDDIMMTAAMNENLTAAYIDSTTINRKPTISRYIEKIFAVSDNDAYNRLYEWLGQDYINESLQSSKTCTESIINHRLGLPGLSALDNRMTNPIRFFRDNNMIYDQVAMTSTKNWKHRATNAKKGLGYLNQQDSLINLPFDFGSKNFYTLQEMQLTLQKIMFPDYFAPSERFRLKDEDYAFLRNCLSDLPRQYAFYTNQNLPDGHVKFLMYGGKEINIPHHIKIYNKVGNAYGYLIDCAYIEDKKNDISFFLTAMIHVNKNKIYNDGVYEYDEIGLPFLKKLGLAFYQYELEKQK